MNARQLGLKYIANVTYGYTGATFSGRMPAVEIADSIVQTGREILEEVFATCIPKIYQSHCSGYSDYKFYNTVGCRGQFYNEKRTHPHV